MKLFANRFDLRISQMYIHGQQPFTAPLMVIVRKALLERPYKGSRSVARIYKLFWQQLIQFLVTPIPGSQSRIHGTHLARRQARAERMARNAEVVALRQRGDLDVTPKESPSTL